MRVKNRKEASGCCSCITGGGSRECCSLCLIISDIFLFVAGFILLLMTSDHLTTGSKADPQKMILFDDTQKDLQRYLCIKQNAKSNFLVIKVYSYVIN